MEAIDPNIFRLTIFVLSIFVGYYVVWSVTPALHTPLMAVTNAISSVIIVGGLFALVSSTDQTFLGILSKSFGFIAVLLAAVNIFGGFLVTQRMLAMYKKKPKNHDFLVSFYTLLTFFVLLRIHQIYLPQLAKPL